MPSPASTHRSYGRFAGNGLPTAFQLVVPPFDEARLLRAARAYERETA